MKTTGTAIHCKNTALINAIATNKYLDRLFFMLKSLNFNPIKRIGDIIK
jgi:hypothetical protein